MLLFSKTQINKKRRNNKIITEEKLTQYNYVKAPEYQ